MADDMKYDADDYTELKDGVRIDRDDLDAEAIVQPNRFFHASEGHAFAISRRDRKKHDLEVAMAGLDRDVRDAMVADGERVTEDKVKAQISREQDYHRATGEYLDACLEADRWEALRSSYRQRADMLRVLLQDRRDRFYGEVTGAAERRGAHDRYASRQRD